jgi:hypothetical protein
LLPLTIAVFVALIPVVAGITSLWFSAHNAAARHAEQSASRVRAVLLTSAAGPLETDHGANTWTDWVPARWTLAGHEHTGLVPANAGTPAGSAVTVFLNRRGEAQALPMSSAEVRAWVESDTLLAMLAVAVALAGLIRLARRALDRRRLAGWETAWLAVGPRWSRHP